jgi:universal stress protein A
MKIKNILVPIDFSVSAERALDYACSLAEQLSATVHLVHALGEVPLPLRTAVPESLLESVRGGALQSLQKLSKDRTVIASFGRLIVELGSARDVIIETADELHVDLIVASTHGRGGAARLLLGSVADQVTRHAHCPVLLLPCNVKREHT